MFNRIAISIVLASVFACNFAIGKNHLTELEHMCKYAPGLTVGNRTIELQCCTITEKIQFRRWSSGSKYLSTYLEKLQAWKCPQFQSECENPTFNYNKFTSLMYKRFCNQKAVEEQCLDEVRSVVEKQTKKTASFAKWNEVLKRLNVYELTDQELLRPCLQIAMYDADSGNFDHFHEVIEPITPFCSFVWCGFDQKIVENRKISSWTCMPKSCQANIIIVMVVIAILGVATFICNATVIAVLTQNKSLQNGQAIYRLSLAFADILVGAIVFPTFITTLQKYFLVPHEMAELKNITGYRLLENGTADLTQLSTVEAFESPFLFRTRFSRSYLNLVGFFTILSLFVSVNTLVAACVDRLIAVYRPLTYNKNSAIVGARIAVILIWILALIFSTIPFYVHDMRYGVVAAILISSAGTEVVILYAVAFIIPLLIVWSTTITTFIIAKNRARATSTCQSRRNSTGSRDFEMRLLQTLVVMVGVFSLCLLPSIMILLAGFFLPDIYFNDPLKLNQTTASNFTSLEVVAVILLTSNSLWNCFIYSARDQSFRNAAKLLYGRMAARLRIDYLWKMVCSKLSGNQNGLARPESQASTTGTTNDVQNTSIHDVCETNLTNLATNNEAN